PLQDAVRYVRRWGNVQQQPDSQAGPRRARPRARTRATAAETGERGAKVSKAEKPNVTESDTEQAMRCKYGGQEWACLFNVANGTGMNCNRRADAIAMSLWPSRGLTLHGHEIKVARSDWLREIQDVSKAEAFAKHCHYWWIVAPKCTVKLEELP